MAKHVSIALTEEEVKFVLSALDRASVSGIRTAHLVVSVSEKIQTASRFSAERPAPRRQALDQALLSRVTPAEKTVVDFPNNGVETEAKS